MIQITYEVTYNSYTVKEWLNSINSPFAADFEVSSLYSDKKKEFFKNLLKNSSLSDEDKRLYKQMINADGLSYPSLNQVTHLSIADNNHHGKVIVLDDKLRQLVFNFLITTDKIQIWHNSCYDFTHIYYHTKSLPKKYIDTQILTKCLLNNTNNAKAITGLKVLESHNYGDWAISKDDFKIEEQHEDYFLRYAATDACATYKLYEDILEKNKWTLQDIL